jgi:hypothetical protein
LGSSCGESGMLALVEIWEYVEDKGVDVVVDREGGIGLHSGGGGCCQAGGGLCDGGGDCGGYNLDEVSLLAGQLL